MLAKGSDVPRAHGLASEPDTGSEGQGAVYFLVDDEGHARYGYNVKPVVDRATFVVVRPDGVIGAVAFSADSVGRYFTLITA